MLPNMIATLSTPSLQSTSIWATRISQGSCRQNYHIKRVSIFGIPGNNLIRNQKALYLNHIFPKEDNFLNKIGILFIYLSTNLALCLNFLIGKAIIGVQPNNNCYVI
jgi:hypothetical protein